ncbi:MULTISPECIES: 4Fe-4S binding protein [Pelosinus]|uniref:4Fe-4S binding protein n=1 Tax=Pelosinus baikalensis TaxID=2892015 RepID=A0ABS8HQZ3_9FIRM|nr:MULTISPECIES: 4Fe-4S binding protein [Pelosinus]MCC5464984.1 4Fe-4S binding protein [Pelosinus baikalensis]
MNEGNVIFTILTKCVECGACAAVCPVGAILAP